MIKLALLLRHPTPDAALDPELRAALEGCGLLVTGCGRASVTVQAPAAVCASLFGPQHALDPNATLPVPAPLAPAISLITIAPRHAPPGPA